MKSVSPCPAEQAPPRRLPKQREPRPRLDAFLRKYLYFPALLLKWLGVRFVLITVPQRIGHLVLEPDVYLKDTALDGVREMGVMLLLPEDTANTRVVEYWRKYFTIFQGRWMVELLRPFLLFDFLRRDLMPYAAVENESAKAYLTHARWGSRPPLLELLSPELEAGRAALQRWGLPPDAWFVCIHSREGGYSPEDEHVHSYRNAPIADYIPAMQAITAAGGWCIRMGDPTMAALPPMPGVIDYAVSSDKSEELDIFLCAQCRFLLGNSSGLYQLAKAFGRPCALANQVPLAATYGVGIDDVAIPKTILRDGKPVSLEPLFRTPAAGYRYAKQYAEDGLEVVNNTPEQILALAREMMDRLDEKDVYTPADEARQAAFRSLFRPGDYSHGAASRIGRDFLRELDDPVVKST